MRNDEFDVATDVNAFDVVKFVKVLNAQKKSAWTDLDRVSFKKFVKESNVEIKKSAWTDLDRVSFKKKFKELNVENEKLAWTGLGKVKRKASSAASVFNLL